MTRWGKRLAPGLVLALVCGVFASTLAPQADAGEVTICHRTGSATNPYVQITISRNVLDAHLRHGDPAPTGGPCPGATAAHERPRGGNDKVTICHRTGSATNPYVVITIARAGWENGHSKHEGDRLLGPGDDPARLCVAQGAQGAAATPSTSSGCRRPRPSRCWSACGTRQARRRSRSCSSRRA
jgi:hypothetical protein